MAYHADIFHGTYATLQENSCWIYEAKGNKALIDKTGRTCWRRISWVVVLRMGITCCCPTILLDLQQV